MASFVMKTQLPPYLRDWQEIIEGHAREYGLDFFEVIYEKLDFDTMNQIASYGGFPVRYRDAGVAFEVQATGGANEFELDPISLTGSAGGATPASVEVDWGDGTVQAYVAPGFAAPAGYVHAYAGPGEYRVRVTVQPGNVSATKTVSVP